MSTYKRLLILSFSLLPIACAPSAEEDTTEDGTGAMTPTELQKELTPAERGVALDKVMGSYNAAAARSFVKDTWKDGSVLAQDVSYFFPHYAPIIVWKWPALKYGVLELRQP